MTKKYEFTGETKQVAGRTLRRIRALAAVGLNVSAGECGGWVESESNLSRVYGDAWVYGDARVASMSDYCAFQSFGSYGRTTTAHKDSKLTVRVNCGCFSGSIEEFRVQVNGTYKEGDKHRLIYLGMANMIEEQLK